MPIFEGHGKEKISNSKAMPCFPIESCEIIGRKKQKKFSASL